MTLKGLEGISRGLSSPSGGVPPWSRLRSPVTAGNTQAMQALQLGRFGTWEAARPTSETSAKTHRRRRKSRGARMVPSTAPGEKKGRRAAGRGLRLECFHCPMLGGGAERADEEIKKWNEEQAGGAGTQCCRSPPLSSASGGEGKARLRPALRMPLDGAAARAHWAVVEAARVAVVGVGQAEVTP